MNVWVIVRLFLLTSGWTLVPGLADMSGALTGILLARLLSRNNGNNQPAPKPPVLIPPRICIQRVPVPYPIQVPVRVPVQVKVKERVEVKVPVPFRVKEPFPIRVPFPFPYPVEREVKPTEPTKPPRLLPPPVIHLPPNIIHNFIPQPENKFIAINRRPLVQHFYPRPKPELKPEPLPEPEPEPQPEPEPEPEKDEHEDMALLAKIEALRARNQLTSFSGGFGGPAIGGMRSPIIPLDPTACLIRGLAPGSAFVPGVGYMSGGASHPFQGMNMNMGGRGGPTAVFNHMMPQSFPMSPGAYPPSPAFGPNIMPNMGFPAFNPNAGIPVSSLPQSPDVGSYPPSPGPPGPGSMLSFHDWKQDSGQQVAGGEKGRNCHKICHQ